MPTIKAKFDGKAFVPCEPVDLPVGSQVDIVLPSAREATSEGSERWEEIQRHIDATDPHFPTLQEAMEYLRKRPYDPD